jgi:hypothetical protein
MLGVLKDLQPGPRPYPCIAAKVDERAADCLMVTADAAHRYQDAAHTGAI